MDSLRNAPPPRPAAPTQPAAVPPAAVAGTPRNPGLVVLWTVLTFNLYWIYWLYRNYHEIRARAPGSTQFGPGQAAGFLFIPLFNLAWIFAVAFDFPRAIARMQTQDGLGEPPVNRGLVTGLISAGFVFNVLSAFDWVFLGAGELLFLSGLLVAQRSLNTHWERLGRPEVSRYAAGAAIAMGGGVALFVSLFLPWWVGRLGSGSLSAWQWYSHVDILLAVIAVVIGALAVTGYATRDPAPFAVAGILAVLALGLSAPILDQFNLFVRESIDQSDLFRWGHYVAPIASMAAALGSLVVLTSPRVRPAPGIGATRADRGEAS